MAIRPSMTPNQTDEERIEQILKEHREWMRGIRTDRLIGTNSAQAKQALLEIVQEARIDELHQAFKHIENGQNWNDYIHRAIDQLSTNNNTKEGK